MADDKSVVGNITFGPKQCDNCDCGSDNTKCFPCLDVPDERKLIIEGLKLIAAGKKKIEKALK